MATLRMERPEVIPARHRAHPEMVALIERLVARGHTYTDDGSVYFRISSFPGLRPAGPRSTSPGMKAGARVDTDKYDKENARDFVLWKAKSDEPAWAQWDAPFGRGRPGWHIECSAMSMKYLGETFDIHCGGVDLIFPHHENEIAQSECGTGQTFVRHWMHVEHLLVENETMSKSKGNFFTIPDLVARGHRPDAIRYLLASAHYRKQLNFTFEGLDHAQAALERIHSLVQSAWAKWNAPGPVGEAEAACRRPATIFAAALGDDLNTPEALAAVHNLVTRANALLAARALTREGAARVTAELQSMDGVFGVFFPGATTRCPPRSKPSSTPARTRGRGRDFAAADAARERASRPWASCSRTRPRARAGGGRGEPASPRVRRGPRARARSGEDLAAAHLRREGLVVLARNYRCRGGELDLVARDRTGRWPSWRSRSAARRPTAAASRR